MGEHEEHIVFEMGYNKGFKDGIKGSIPKADYENRLKADLKAILVELQLEIEESCICTYEVTRLIKQKINALEGNKHWIDNADSYKCPICYYETTNPARINYKCPQCGFVDVNDLGKINALEGKNEQRKEKTQENI